MNERKEKRKTFDKKVIIKKYYVVVYVLHCARNARTANVAQILRRRVSSQIQDLKIYGISVKTRGRAGPFNASFRSGKGGRVTQFVSLCPRAFAARRTLLVS